MPWPKRSTVQLRREFVELALADGSNVRELARRYGISRTTAYKFLKRYESAGVAGLEDRSRRPRRQPRRVPSQVEDAVVGTRREHPAWGPRKIAARLRMLGAVAPAPSTVQSILHRNGLISPTASAAARPFMRFERPEPNDLWQMDFKGHFPMRSGGRCHPLTVIDDHSRYLVGLQACSNETAETVEERLTGIFRRYGMPWAMLADNGTPWGCERETQSYGPTEVWLFRRGVDVLHGRPRHPQTQGKDERLHRTLKAELLGTRTMANLEDAQQQFDAWRPMYNAERPHEALGNAPPISRYRPSKRHFEEKLPPIEYGPNDSVRVVQSGGIIGLRGHHFRVGKAFRGEPVGIRPTLTDGVFDVFYCEKKIATLDLNQP